MANAGKPATIREVALRAGVSTATVSRALRKSASVDPRTRTRVERAAQDLRYRPSGVARSLKLRATQTIGLIVTDIENPYFPQIVRAVEDTAREHDYSVILADGRRDADREIQSLELLAQRQVDGLLIASSALTERHQRWIEERPCPVVIINSPSTAADVSAVLSDNAEGGRLVAKHLLDLGHREVAYIGVAESHNAAAEERLQGMRALISGGARSTLELRTVLGTSGVDGGEHSALEVLRAWPGVTAIACYNDLTAVGALRGLRSAGLSVPSDVSLVGFDDIEFAPYLEPPLTTVRQATDRMGRWAVRTLLDSIDPRADQVARKPESAARVVTERIPVEMVVRGTTGPASIRAV